MRTATSVFLGFLLFFIIVLIAAPSGAQNAPLPVPDAPPRASLITLSAPDSNGRVTVTGAAGAAPGNVSVLLISLNTGHYTRVVAGSNGSFTGSVFAPYGSTILARTYSERGPGTILYVPARSGLGGGGGVPFSGSGWTLHVFQAPSYSPSWTLDGTIDSARLNPGESLTVRGTLRVVSSQIQAGSRIRVQTGLAIERLTGPDGVATCAVNMLSSAILTPTGLPIENSFNIFGPNSRATLDLMVEPGAAMGTIELTLPLPADFLAGYYLPYLSFAFEGIQFDPPSEGVTGVGSHFGRPPSQGGGQNAMYLPVIRLGNPAPPRMFWSLLVDTLNNGTRGVRAVEDRNLYGIVPRVATNSDTFIVPRTNPATGAPYRYRLEPFVVQQAVGTGDVPPNPPKIPLRLPSGSLTVRIEQPDGSVQTIGPAPFAQIRMKTPVGRNGGLLDDGGGHITHAYELSTMDPSFEVAFTRDGLHRITVEGSVEDVWGNVWSGGGAYEVYVARPLALDTAVLPGTPFGSGDVFNPAILVTPPVPATVEARLRQLPLSDVQRAREQTIRGAANRFGYFSPAGAGLILQDPGEYRVDITASYIDAQGNLWMGSRTWGGVVASRAPKIQAHGKRGVDGGSDANNPRSQWFFRTQTGIPIGGSHTFFPFNSGDVAWLQKTDSVAPTITFQDPTNSIHALMRARAICCNMDQDAASGEITPGSGRADRFHPHFDPSRVDLWGYAYVSVQRPLVRVREEINQSAGVGSPYWRFKDQYALQIGAAPGGDLPNDFKFQYGGVVLRGAALSQPQYDIYGSLFVLVPEIDPGGGTRVFPPFQGNGAGPSGGPIMKLKGQDVDLFIHPTGVRPGSVLEVGDNFSLVGSVGPPLPAMVSTKVTTPTGRILQFSGRANRVGYYYRPQDDFAVTEPGIYTVDVRVTFDGQTSAGQVSTPFPTGDVLGSANGRFFVYVVPRDSPLLTTSLPETMTVVAPGQLDITARAPAGQNLTSGHVTTMMPGFLLQTNQLTATAGALSYRYDPATLARDFPNLDLNPPADVVTISLFGQTTNAQGQPTYAARVLALHGQEFFNLTPTRAPARAVASVSAASFSGTTLASESIVAAFGAGLAINTQAAATLPLPSSLAGTTINVRDSAGAERQSPLFFVSPAQANYQMPPGTVPGAATVTITNRYGEVSAGTVQIAAVAPGLFAANANGQGVAAAAALRVKADGSQQFEPVSRFDPAQNRFVPTPIDLGPATDQVFLILFGTGTRFRSSLSSVSARIGGVDAPVLFAGAQGDFVGLDQINLQLPRSLIGRGEVEIRLTADGQPANAVTVNIK
jgi:uncharacterized protein (TIGR03437 family)